MEIIQIFVHTFAICTGKAPITAGYKNEMHNFLVMISTNDLFQIPLLEGIASCRDR